MNGYREVEGTGSWTTLQDAQEIELALAKIRCALGSSVEWAVALPLIWEFARRDYASLRSLPEALEAFRNRCLKGEWPVKDGCPKCFGLTCLACDFHGTRAGYEEMSRLMEEAYAAGDEAERERADYIARGICSRCGAASPEQAATLCRPTSDESGEVYCPAEDLWESRNA